MSSLNSLNSRRSFKVGRKSYDYFSLKAAEKAGLEGVSRLPFCLKVLLENLLRFEDGETVTLKDIHAVLQWLKKRRSKSEINYRPARVLMQDFTGVPAVVDLGTMRDAIVNAGGKGRRINPLTPVDLVIDHSIMIDSFGTSKAMKENMDLEFKRNGERYAFLRWGQEAFDNFRVVPPGNGICHQVNIEYLARGVWTQKEGKKTLAFPDTCIGTDSHTTMVNGLGVLGWGVGGIEAEAAMLGQPVSMVIPEVVGFRLTGKIKEGVTTTDVVLVIVERLRKLGVVGKFVEFYGSGLKNLSLPERCTIANMAPEYGATCGIFPIDEETVRYMKMTARKPSEVALVEAYAKAQGLWRSSRSPEPVFTTSLTLDLSTVEPSMAGPRRPQDRLSLPDVPSSFVRSLREISGDKKRNIQSAPVKNQPFSIEDGSVVIAAITSCTNTSNPDVLIAAGLVAKKAVALGLKQKPWVKTSLAPGSQVVADYLKKAKLQTFLNRLGFNIVGFGCTTCIGNSGPLDLALSESIQKKKLVVAAVLSGNRNFEGRINPYVKANYLASPPLVVVYALTGTLNIDVTKEPVGQDKKGNPVYLRDIWPSSQEIQEAGKIIGPAMFRARYRRVFEGPPAWKKIKVPSSDTYLWDARSTYVRKPPFFDDLHAEKNNGADIINARPLAILGDSVTTDHISPAGSIAKNSPAGAYLLKHKVKEYDFNSYGARRGNHEVMLRGTFSNIRIRNKIVPKTEGGFTKYYPGGEIMSIYDAAMNYQKKGVPLVVIGGKEYGTGSSRDWAAKGTRLLGIRAVLVESFERIHRSNLIGMGVLPLQFLKSDTQETLGLKGTEIFDILGLEKLKCRSKIDVRITSGRKSRLIKVLCRIDTANEMHYYRSGGILHYVLKSLMN